MSGECVIGLDIGGTKIAGGVVAFPEGLVRCRRTIATRADRGGEPVLQDVIALARELLHEAHAMRLEPIGIGAGVAELVDLSGNVTSSATIRWKGTPVAGRLSEIAPAV
ncbi:MAG: ROK family protein, partial [Candidatus Solibacter sp.]|nr:ROK family protein [Candidatus Solibacter sp.]